MVGVRTQALRAGDEDYKLGDAQAWAVSGSLYDIRYNAHRLVCKHARRVIP